MVYSQHQPFNWSEVILRKNKKGMLARDRRVNMNSCVFFFFVCVESKVVFLKLQAKSLKNTIGGANLLCEI